MFPLHIFICYKVNEAGQFVLKSQISMEQESKQAKEIQIKLSQPAKTKKFVDTNLIQGIK